MASPLNMGLLTENGPPDWHPSPAGLRECALKCAEKCKDRGTTIMRVAEGFSMRWDEMRARLCQDIKTTTSRDSTIVIGFANPSEVWSIFK